MFDRTALVVTCALLLGSCAGDSEVIPRSAEAPPQVEFTQIVPPEVFEGWPCPPFLTFDTTLDKTDDDDGDNILDCQEEFLGSDPNDVDSDDDAVPDFLERGNLTADLDDEPSDAPDGILDEGEGLDTDRDGILDIIDPDDDGDGIPTIEEDSKVDGLGNGNGDPLDDDYDNDGVRNYLDPDNEGDYVWDIIEDKYAGNDDGDPRNDDFDGDGIPNYVDTDDDGDGADGCEDSGDRRVDGTTFTVRIDGVDYEYFNDDADLDGIMNFMDLDDDGDGILTEDEDWDGSGNACDDDIDRDLTPDFRDLDDDGDTVESINEDLDGSGSVLDDDTDGDKIPNFRDNDDDGDGTPSFDERPREGGFDARDTDRDRIPDYLDDDDDNDGFTSFEENTDSSSDSQPRDPDDDGDKCPTALEPSTRLDENVKPAGCEYYTLTINGLVDEAYNGARVFFALRNGDDDLLGVANAVVDRVSDAGDVTFVLQTDFPMALEVNQAHTLDYFVDVDEDGLCAAEASYRTTVTAPSNDKAVDYVVAVDLVADADVNACVDFPN